MIVLNDVLKGKHSVAIGGHIRPDGDCVLQLDYIFI